MQGLTSYGSDSDEDSSDRTESRTAAPADSVKPPAVRLLPKASTSAASTPSSRIAHPNSNSVTTTPLARRESSASPPPFRVAKSTNSDSQRISATKDSQRLDSLALLPSTSSASLTATSVSSPASTRTSVQLDSLAEFGIPPISTEPSNPVVVAKLNQFYALSLPPRSLHFNDSLASSKAFRNPRIYEKLVEFVELGDQGVSRWDRNVWDGDGLATTGAAIAELQKARSEARNQAQTPGSRSSIAFASSSSSTAAPSHRPPSNSTSKGGEKRSRWDNGTGTNAGGAREGKRERSRSPKRR